MNFYLFVDPQYKDLSDSELWNDGLFAAAVWESSENSARTFAKEFYSGYNALWNIRYIKNPKLLSEGCRDEPSDEWDT